MASSENQPEKSLEEQKLQLASKYVSSLLSILDELLARKGVDNQSDTKKGA